jgi:hypothetical protein
MGLKDMDCHASLAMTGSGLPRFARNDDGDGYDEKILSSRGTKRSMVCRVDWWGSAFRRLAKQLVNTSKGNFRDRH